MYPNVTKLPFIGRAKSKWENGSSHEKSYYLLKAWPWCLLKHR